MDGWIRWVLKSDKNTISFLDTVQKYKGIDEGITVIYKELVGFGSQG